MLSDLKKTKTHYSEINLAKMSYLWTSSSLPQSLSRVVYSGQRTSDCELGEWSQWSSCMKKNKTCGFRKGSQSRSRVPLPQVHSPDTSLALVPSQTCAPETERKKCTLSKKAPCGRGKCTVQTQETHLTEKDIR